MPVDHNCSLGLPILLKKSYLFHILHKMYMSDLSEMSVVHNYSEVHFLIVGKCWTREEISVISSKDKQTKSLCYLVDSLQYSARSSD